MRYLQLIGVYFKLGVLGELEYRINFFIQIFQTLLGLLVSLGGLSVIFEHTRTLNGWSPDELLAVVGVYFLIGGFIHLVIQPSLSRFMEDIRMGTLDFLLMKPADSQLLVSVRQMQIWKVVDMLLGLGILVVVLVRLGGTLGMLEAAQFLIALLCGGAIVYSVWLMLATITFWFVRVDNILVVFESMYEAGRYPVSIYPAWLRFALTFMVPIAFAVTVPAEALTSRLESQTLIFGIVFALVLLVVSRLFWMYGIRNYTGASA